MLYRTIFFLVLLAPSIFYAQTLPSERSVDWTKSGLQNITVTGFEQIDMEDFNVVGDGTTPNDSNLATALASVSAPGAIIIFPNGNFLFNTTIELPSNVIIKGQGATNTTFTMNLGGSGHSISIGGSANNAISTAITEAAIKDADFIMVDDASAFSVGDWIQILKDDSSLVTSDWAANTVGQIVKIKSITGNQIELTSSLRLSLAISETPSIQKINQVENVGIECLKIVRQDSTVPNQSSNLFFQYAVNSWVSGVESENCTYSHVEARYSSNLYITKSYFHHGFEYGSGGRAYGVMLHHTTNECLVENNIFEHLRHSMIVQAGANGNVFAFNYSTDPFWDVSFPLTSDSAGDIVLHGNYVFSNLFEQNVAQNIVIDNSHGPNGEHNTFFRNRAEKFGIFFSADNSPNQNIIGNDITNNSSPYNIVNYTILGAGHFLHGNNNKGTIDPVGTETLSDASYAYTSKPEFVPDAQWAAMGTPNSPGAVSIPAADRYNSNAIFTNSCAAYTLSVNNIKELKAVLYPNPVENTLIIESPSIIDEVVIFNQLGSVVLREKNVGRKFIANIDYFHKGIYFVQLKYANHQVLVKKMIKM